jgi:hypothetical protein
MTAARESCFALRVVTSPFNPDGLALSRHVIRVAIDPLIPEPQGVFVKVWSGSAYVSSPLKTWNGTAFVNAVSAKTWNGTAWV